MHAGVPELITSFFVYVIESPKPLEILAGTSLGPSIQNIAQLNRLGCVVKTVRSSEEFRMALTEVFVERRKRPGSGAVLHLLAHGDHKGIELTDGTYLTWSELQPSFSELNTYLNNQLFLCTCSCGGYNANVMALLAATSPGQNPPFAANVGCTSELTWGDAAVAFPTLYHLLAKGYSIVQSVVAMNIAAGRNDIKVETSEGVVEKVRNLLLEQLQSASSNSVTHSPTG